MTQWLASSLPQSQPSPRQHSLMRHGVDTSHIHLSDLTVAGTLGVGSYSRVELVHMRSQPQCTFAQKRMSKSNLAYKQQIHIAHNEKIALQIASSAQCPFIVQLYRTIHDSSYLYFLIEPLLGGDLQTLIRQSHLPLFHVRFYAACVVEGLEFLHKHFIVYRSLKPEDILLCEDGYIKLSDFGSSKRLAHSSDTTRSFCGTPEYLAPELLQDTPHGLPVDLWALGVLVYELSCGKPPFKGSTDKASYDAILTGIDAIQPPVTMNRHTLSLVQQLCRKNPKHRLASGDSDMTALRQHPFFESFSWLELRERRMLAPYVPSVHGEIDLGCFDTYPPEQEHGEVTQEEDMYWNDF